MTDRTYAVDQEPVSSANKIVGNAGESAAGPFLEAQGYGIVDANVRPIGGRKRGEIDLIAWHGDVLVFIEVKTRRSLQWSPAEAVDLRKRRQLLLLAQAYLDKHRLDGVACRFDVVEVVNRNGTLDFNLLQNAFDGNDI